MGWGAEGGRRRRWWWEEGEWRGRGGQVGGTRERAGAEAGRDVRLRAESHGAPLTALQKQAWATNMELFVARGVADADEVGKVTKPKAAVVPRAATLEWMLKLENASRVRGRNIIGPVHTSRRQGRKGPAYPR
jgi:hypothetical protein